jgi:hypothetical protein
LISNTGGSIIVPLAADFTIANIPDNQMYIILTASLPFTMIKRMLYISADLDTIIMNCTILAQIWDFN